MPIFTISGRVGDSHLPATELDWTVEIDPPRTTALDEEEKYRQENRLHFIKL